MIVRACIGLLLALVLSASPHPVVQRYCLSCHSSAKRIAEVDLEAPLPQHPRSWQKALEQLALEEMPPKGMPQPTAQEKAQLDTWIRGELRQAALARAGDPGPVVLRRLDNAEYTYTIRDLTGVPTLDPAKEFPADGAAGEGFTNTGNALSMSPALVTKYLDAAKSVARHAVLEPDGIRFSRFTTARDQTNETLEEIRAFYARFTETGGADTVTQQGVALDKNRGGTLPLAPYLEATLAIRDGQLLARVAQQRNLSPKYLNSLVQLLQSNQPSLLLDPLRQQWRRARTADVPTLVNRIQDWQQTLWKYSTVGHIGKLDGPKAWLEPVTPLAERQDFRVPLPKAGSQNEVTLTLAAYDAGDGPEGDSVLWREPRLLIPGRPPLPLRDVRGLVDALLRRRELVLRSTAEALTSARAADPAWAEYLSIGTQERPRVTPLQKRIEKTADFSFIRGWGGGKEPTLLANSSTQAVRVPGQMKAHAVAVLPTATQQAAVGWRSPLNGVLRVDVNLTPAHAECGNGTLWKLELRRGRSTRVELASGVRRGRALLDRLPVQAGDLLSVLVDARDGNSSCDLTDIEWQIQSGAHEWSLSKDVAPNGASANPQGLWEYYAEPSANFEKAIPAGSLLARWFLAETPTEKSSLALALQHLLTSPQAPPANTPDAALYRQLTSLASPLLASTKASAETSGSWGLDPARFDAQGHLHSAAPALLELRLPADLADGADFAVSAEPGPHASVQLEVLVNQKSSSLTGLRPSAASVRSKDGVWTSNNQVVSVALPVVAAPNGAAWKRFTAQFQEFRDYFPASLCYTKIVPVDEVVTMTLYHREDSHLSRLLLNAAQQRELDRLWDRLFYVSRAPLLMVDAFEQLYQFATQDADPSKFEPLREPIQQQAAAFRRQLLASEPRHLDAVLAFAGRAYRRPLSASEAAGLRDLYTRLRTQQDLPHEEAVRLTLVRVLSGPAFLYRTEKAAPAGLRQAPVSDWELATRLSYFLWSGPPDEALRKAAAAGKLRTAAGLLEQARRMLRDPKVQRLSVQFGAAWLHLQGFDTLDEKSERHFPTFAARRADLYEESIRFLTDFFTSNRSILSLLDADHTFLNENLARFYGRSDISGPAWRRVDGMKALGRGGVLGQAAVLAKQSGASRTSPILRGNWVAEVLLGDKLPRPPKDVPALPTDEAGLTLTMRELTEKHTSDPRCASCHRRIDPYGFALERFDAIGHSREKDLGGRLIHTRSKLMDGAEIDGLDGLRQYILTKRRVAFVHQFCRKLLGYALGRAVELSDEPLLSQIETRLAATGYPVASAVEMILSSRQFREIRGRDAAVPEEVPAP